MFLGTWHLRIDRRGRCVLPSSFRTLPSSGIVLTCGFERCLQGFAVDSWQALAQQISSLPLGSSDARSVRRLLFADAALAQPDGSSRIWLPPRLRGYAALTDDVVVVGLNTYFEVWPAERWPAVIERAQQSAGRWLVQRAS